MRLNKKTILLALTVLVGASFSNATAKEKINKTKKAEKTEQASHLSTNIAVGEDTLSYAAGQMLTQGLMDYVIQHLKVDTTYMAAFVSGIEESLFTTESPEAHAKAAGGKIAGMIKDNMIPQMKKRHGDLSLPFNEDVFKKGFIDAVSKDTAIFTVEAASQYHEKVISSATEKKNKEAVEKGKAWLEENAKMPGVISLPSGLQYKVIREGKGVVAKGNDKVTVKYEGRLLDGTVFDSSYKRNPQTTEFSPSEVIKGWTEALYLMPEGSEWELYIPYNLAYGSRAAGKIPAFSTLIFKIELVKVEKKEQ